VTPQEHKSGGPADVVRRTLSRIPTLAGRGLRATLTGIRLRRDASAQLRAISGQDFQKPKANNSLWIVAAILTSAVCLWQVFSAMELRSHLDTGMKCLRAGDFDDCVAQLTKYIGGNPHAPDDVYLARAAAYGFRGESQNAIRDYDFVIARSGSSEKLLLLRARERAESHDFDGGLADCDTALAQNLKSTRALELRAAIKTKAGDYNGAIHDAERSLTLQDSPDPLDSLRPLKSMALAATKAGKFDQAVRLYSTAITMDAQNPNLYALRAQALARLQQWSAVIADCDHVGKLVPGNGDTEALRRLAESRLRQIGGAQSSDHQSAAR
jgi:tetratricopeptide (TPR) repeat protein